jgi:hypothetical protein
MSFFEIGMLVCFGVSWPISIAKTLRTRNVSGKSPVFLAIICLGYGFGIAHKLIHSPDWVTGIYALNLFMVAFDLGLYFKFAGRTCLQPNNDIPSSDGSERTMKTESLC